MAASATTDPLEKLRQLVAATDQAAPGSGWLRRLDTATLRAFLAAHQTPAAAAAKLGETAAWRAEYGTDEILQTWPNDASPGAVLVRAHWPVGIAGRNHRGCPVLVNRFSRVDFGALQSQVGMELMLRHAVYFLELVSMQARQHGCEHASTVLFDAGCEATEEATHPASDWMSLASYTRGMLAYVAAATKVTEAHYPGLYADIFFVRAPKYFADGWRFAAPMLDERTRGQTHLHGDVPLESLLERMPMHSIPACLGGASPLSLPEGGMLAKDPAS